ncbi:MAG: class I SAM-dependent methyltransferase [Thermodesulfobacteriota bacterium]
MKSLLYRFSRKYMLGKFDFWERHGIHITPVSYYSPIPNTKKLKEKYPSEIPEIMEGFDWNEKGQIKIMHEVFPLYAQECSEFSQTERERTNVYDYYVQNQLFPIGDACILHSLIRHFKPGKIIEIGSGFSTLVAARAATYVTPAPMLKSINPFPGQFEDLFQDGFPGFTCLEKTPVEDLPLEYFDQLQEGDMLFIDSSHVIRPMEDVLFLYLKVIPRLNPGVIVHAHDIFLPYHMPKEFVFEKHWFWNEQYLLQALLTFNSEYEVLFSAQYMKKYKEESQSIFPEYWPGGSFWFRRKNKT